MDHDPQLTSFGRYTGEALRVLFGARRVLGRLGGTEITPEHLLLAMLTPDAGAAYERLERAAIPMDEMRSRLEDSVRTERHLTFEDAPLADATHVLLDRALNATPGKVGSDDLLLALCEAPGVAGDELRRYFNQ